MLGQERLPSFFLKGILSRDASSCQVHAEHNSSGVGDEWKSYDLQDCQPMTRIHTVPTLLCCFFISVYYGRQSSCVII